MRWSKAFLPTFRELPAEAEIVSHQLMLRAGLMRKLAAGVFSYLPLGWRCIANVTRIVREEMDRTGAQEVVMPVLQPAELWQESGRWQAFGRELMRLRDRHDRDFALGPTHEEVITTLARSTLRSYRQLPQNLYQIQVKFRDEARPRFGVVRTREFIMKDAYSFDPDGDGLGRSYQALYDAYVKIFTRCGLVFRAVEVEAGLIEERGLPGEDRGAAGSVLLGKGARLPLVAVTKRRQVDGLAQTGQDLSVAVSEAAAAQHHDIGLFVPTDLARITHHGTLLANFFNWEFFKKTLALQFVNDAFIQISLDFKVTFGAAALLLHLLQNSG